MIKIWAKVMTKEKIVDQLVYESIDNFSPETFHLHVAEICHKLDLPTPIVLPAHIKHFIFYNNTTFKPRDFVESVNFEKLNLENFRQN
ncbi:MAG: hypothetical protein IJ542_01005 [Clostridia bacterium]|nr:hypothetical protein [Clostridia bacterium]